MGSRAPNIAPSRDELEPCSCNISPLLTPPISLSLPPFFHPSGSPIRNDSIEDKVWVRSGSTRHEPRREVGYISNNSKVVWIDELFSPLLREDYSRSILIFHPLERGVKQGGTHCAGGGLIEVTWCLRSDVIPSSSSSSPPSGVISFVFSATSLRGESLWYLSIPFSDYLLLHSGEISVGDYREAAFHVSKSLRSLLKVALIWVFISVFI